MRETLATITGPFASDTDRPCHCARRTRTRRHVARDIHRIVEANVVENLRELLEQMCLPSPEDFGSDVARYSGQADLDENGSIESRHVDHPDNARAVSALLRDLRDLGYCAYKHDFSSRGGRSIL